MSPTAAEGWSPGVVVGISAAQQRASLSIAWSLDAREPAPFEQLFEPRLAAVVIPLRIDGQETRCTSRAAYAASSAAYAKSRSPRPA